MMSGQIMKTKTVITFVPNIDHQNEVNQDTSNATNNLEKMNFENQGKMEEYDSNWRLFYVFSVKYQ